MPLSLRVAMMRLSNCMIPGLRMPRKLLTEFNSNLRGFAMNISMQ